MYTIEDLKNSVVQHLLTNIDDGFFFLDNDWIVRYWNPTAETSLLCSKERIIGENFWEFFKDSRKTIFYEQYLKAKQSDTPVEFVGYYSNKDAWLQTRAFPTPEGLAVLFTDITAKRKLSKTIEAKKNEQEVIINASKDLIWSVDIDFNLIAANSVFQNAAAGYLGCALQVGQNVSTISTREEWAKWQPYYQKVITSRNTVIHEFHVQFPNGDVSYTEVTFNPILEDERIIAIACYGRDITHSRRHIMLIEDKNRKLEEKQQELDVLVEFLTIQNRRLKEIAFIQSHEVRRPLANILGLVELVSAPAENCSDYMPLIKKSAEELDHVIRTIVTKSTMLGES